MRLSVFIILILFISANLLFAQKGVEYSAFISPNFSWIINNNDKALSDTDRCLPSFGGSAGLTVGYNFTDNFGLATGLAFVYSQQNYIKISSINEIDKLQHTKNRRLSYLRLPILFRLSGDPQARVTYYARFGANVDMLLTANSTESYPITASVKDVEINYRNVKDGNGNKQTIFNQFVFGLMADIGAKIRINDHFALLFLLHLESSISNIDAEDAPKYFPSEQIEVEDVYGKATFLQREHTTFLMSGITLGIKYTPDATKSSIHNNRKKYKPGLWR